MASISFFKPKAGNYAIGYETLHLRHWLEPGFGLVVQDIRNMFLPFPWLAA